MKKIIYELLQGIDSDGSPVLSSVDLVYSEANISIAKQEAYNGEYTIEDDGQPDPTVFPVSPRNVTAGEYITVNGTLYKATAGIPNGEPIIPGQNAIETTVEAQLMELQKGE